jgi:hypothetical protein
MSRSDEDLIDWLGENVARWKALARRLRLDRNSADACTEVAYETLAKTEEERDDAQEQCDRHVKARTCVSCGGLICPPMQCGPCIARAEPTGVPDWQSAVAILRAERDSARASLEAAQAVTRDLEADVNRERARRIEAERELEAAQAREGRHKEALRDLLIDGVTDLGYEGVQQQNVIIADALADAPASDFVHAPTLLAVAGEHQMRARSDRGAVTYLCECGGWKVSFATPKPEDVDVARRLHGEHQMEIYRQRRKG